MTEREQLKQAIAALEAQRALLGDAVVDAGIAPIREKLEALLAKTTTEDQRKQVTVLFADVVGFTAMSETMDAEEVNDVMNAMWRRLDKAILDHGGYIDKHMGDAVMAIWGVDAAREDDPEQAIKAALVMQMELARFNEDGFESGALAHITPTTLQLRLGINTGPALLAGIGSTGEFTAMGDAVNIASRLEHLAPVGGILISHDTYRHVRGIFDVQVLKPVQVKGKVEPIQVYVVQRAKPRAFRLKRRGVEGIETRMIGRQAEFNHLQALLDAMLTDNERQMVTIVGEAGLGKSRLLYEFENWLELLPEPIRYFKARAGLGAQHIPYVLIRDLFAFRFQIQDSDRLRTVRQKIEQGISQTLGNSPESCKKAHLIGQLIGFDFTDSPYVQEALGQADDAAVQRLWQQTLNDLVAYFQASASQRATVILLEDIHWADDSSLNAITHLAAATPKQRLMFVCLTRPALFERRPHWGNGEVFHTRLVLRPLSQRDSRRLVAEILQKVDEVPQTLRELVIRNAEGNPFYTEELIKMLIEDGVIIKGETRWRIAPGRLAEVRVPPTLTGILQARLDNLTPAERIELQRASVVGRTFWDKAVAHLLAAETTVAETAHDPQTDVAAALAALRDKEMIFHRETSAFADVQEYVFKHTLLREVAYESVLKRVRRAYHALVADWLIAYSGERVNEFAGAIAEHLVLAGQTGRAVDYLRQAGEQAVLRGASPEALAFFERALDLLPPDDTRRTAVTVKIGQSLFALGKLEEATHWLEEGLALAQADGDSASMIYALGRLGSIAREQGAYQKAKTRLEESLNLARAAQNQVGIAYALSHLGWGDFRRGAYKEARGYFLDSLPLYREMGDRRSQANALNGLGAAAMMLEAYDEAQQYQLESLALARELGNRRGQAVALTNLGETARLQHDYATARTHMQAARLIFQEVGDPVNEAVVLINLGHVLTALGEYTTAVSHYHEALSLTTKVGATPFVLDALAGLSGALAQTGQMESAAELIGVTTNHPALMGETAKTIEPIQIFLETQLQPELMAACLARGKGRSLAAVTAEILAN